MNLKTLAVLLSLLVAIGRAWAGVDPLPAASSVAGESCASHGWFVTQTDSVSPWALMHVTPRKAPDEIEIASRPRGLSVPGQARFAMPLESLPIALAAVEDALYLVFGADTPGAEGGRRVYRVRAVRDRAGSWTTLPAGGIELVGVLPGEGELLGFGASERGPLAILRDSADATVWLLADDEWRRILTPKGLASQLSEAIAVDVHQAVHSARLLIRGSSGWSRWTVVLQWPSRDSQAAREDAVSTPWDSPRGDLPLAWTCDDIPLPRLDGREIDKVLDTGDAMWLVAWDAKNGLGVRRLAEDAEWKQIERAPRRAATLVLDDVDHVFVAWTADDASGSFARIGWELDLDQGLVVYEGELKLGGPVSRSEYRFLVFVLIVVTASTLAFVLRPEDKRAFHLPYGFSLPGTMRRMMAASLDIGLSLAISHFVFRALGDDMGAMDPDRLTFFDLLTGALVCCFVLGVTGESVGGRTPGKLLLGLRVIHVTTDASGQPIPRAASFGRILLRNTLKWVAFPLAILGALDSEGRGRPDQLAGTVVVLPDEDEAESDDEA